jgi:CheY-like chemotaxis protein
MPVLYLTKDLFFASRVTAAARSLGLEVRVSPSADQLLEQTEDERSLVLLDLDAPGADSAAIVSALRQGGFPSPPIVAFGSHVHEARLQAARQAGCDLVLTRGQFDRQMAEILQSAITKR